MSLSSFGKSRNRTSVLARDRCGRIPEKGDWFWMVEVLRVFVSAVRRMLSSVNMPPRGESEVEVSRNTLSRKHRFAHLQARDRTYQRRGTLSNFTADWLVSLYGYVHCSVQAEPHRLDGNRLRCVEHLLPTILPVRWCP